MSLSELYLSLENMSPTGNNGQQWAEASAGLFVSLVEATCTGLTVLLLSGKLLIPCIWRVSRAAEAGVSLALHCDYA